MKTNAELDNVRKLQEHKEIARRAEEATVVAQILTLMAANDIRYEDIGLDVKGRKWLAGQEPLPLLTAGRDSPEILIEKACCPDMKVDKL